MGVATVRREGARRGTVLGDAGRSRRGRCGHVGAEPLGELARTRFDAELQCDRGLFVRRLARSLRGELHIEGLAGRGRVGDGITARRIEIRVGLDAEAHETLAEHLALGVGAGAGAGLANTLATG